MRNFCVLADALDYIEENLCESISQRDIACACHVSLSCLQKLFKYVFHQGLGLYISRRRLTRAAAYLASGHGVTQTALKYQYNSPEVFTRAFKRLWGTAPSEHGKKWRFTGLYPKIEFNYNGGNIMPKRQVDITQLYDILKEMTDTYILCFDIIGLMEINNISTDAGDAAILECLRRIDEGREDDMLLFRIGGDEFALVTGLTDESAVQALAEKILSLNGGTVKWKGGEQPVSMRAGAMRYGKRNVRYSELFGLLQETIDKARESR
ncbi:MAG: helix-turn-helix domain-containing protein [Eubacteriales bacterium]